MGLLLTYALTYGGAIVAIFRPYVGLLIYICFAIMRPDQLWFWSVKPSNYSKIVAGGMLLGWALNGGGNWRLGRARAVILPLVGFWIWLCLSTAQAVDEALAWKEVTILSKIILPVIVGATLIDSKDKLRQLAWVMAISQGFIAYEMNLAYLQGNPNVGRFDFRGWDNNGNSIAMATTLGLAFFLAISERKLWQKGLAGLLSLLMAHSVIMSFSRGGMLALCVVGLVTFLLLPKKPSHYAIFVFVLLICTRLTGKEVLDRLLTSVPETEAHTGTAGARLDHWANCWQLMTTYPLLGVGPAQYRFYSLSVEGRPKEAHSVWMQTGAETGMVGLALLVSCYGVCLVRMWGILRGDKKPQNAWYRDVARMTIASAAGFIVSAQFVNVICVEHPYYLILLAAGALKLYSQSQVTSSTASDESLIPLAPISGLGVSWTRPEPSTYSKGDPVPDLDGLFARGRVMI